MKNITINLHALEDTITLVAGSVGSQLIHAVYAVVDAAERRGFEQGKASTEPKNTNTTDVIA